MHRWTDVSQVPADFGPSVVTIGNFDGVHRGHRGVLDRTVAVARERGTRSVAVTFDPHPAQVHRPQQAPQLITGLTDRLQLLADAGLDGVLVVGYTAEFALTAAADFVREYLVEGLGAVCIVAGRDVRFGAGNAGDLATLVELGAGLGFDVEVVDDVQGHPPGRRWSSTWVRELLAAGDVATAAQVLGRPHRVRGVVVRGQARGRALGFPTANLGDDASGVIPADGVYAGWMRRLGQPADAPDAYLPVAISVGTNPTFAGTGRRVEAHVPGRTDLELYGEEVIVEFVARLRPMVKFDSVAELVAQMDDDVARTREVVAAGPPGLGGQVGG